MSELQTVNINTELSLFKYSSFEPLPEKYKGLTEKKRKQRIDSALDKLGDKAILLAHNYQNREIVERADFVGDSYGLSKKAAQAGSKYVIFGGVTFMAESADILTSQQQKVLIPSMQASCPMAGMAEALQVDQAWEKVGGEEVIPIAYMNTYADLKAFCAKHGGLVCTSSNASKAFEWALDRGEKILFLPDKHLGENVAYELGLEDSMKVLDPWEESIEIQDEKIILWDGYCQVHERFEEKHIDQVYEKYPNADVVVHPECRREVVEKADKVGSTAQIRDTIKNAEKGETWAVGTEIHLVEHLQRWYPEVNVVALCGDACMDCNAMRQIDPNYLTWTLEELAKGQERNVVNVEDDVKQLAQVALDRMLEI